MSFYIEIIKEEQKSENYVYYIYQFSTSGEQYVSASGKTRYKPKLVSGKLKIDKRNGDVHTLKLAEGDNGMYAKRAAWALMKHWREGNFPDKDCWAS